MVCNYFVLAVDSADSPSRLTWRESNAMGYMAKARKLANYFGTTEKKT